MHVCMHACMHACMHMYICMHVYVHIHIHTCIHVYVHNIYTYIHIHLSYIHIYTYTYILIYIYTSPRRHTRGLGRIYIYTYIHICMYMYIHIHANIHNIYMHVPAHGETQEGWVEELDVHVDGTSEAVLGAPVTEFPAGAAGEEGADAGAGVCGSGCMPRASARERSPSRQLQARLFLRPCAPGEQAAPTKLSSMYMRSSRICLFVCVCVCVCVCVYMISIAVLCVGQ